MRAVRIASVAVIAVIIGGAITLKSLTTYIPVGQVGVRTQEYGMFGPKGVVKKDFGPGWHRDLGPIDSWVTFDSTVQTLEMTRDPSRGDRRGRDDIRVQTVDGNTVDVDVTVKYRIMSGKAHKMFQDTGGLEKYKVIVRSKAEEACMSEFGRMKTEDFYDAPERRKRAAEVKALLTESLKNNYVEVIDVLMRDVEFDPDYEMKIRRKKLADQEVELNKSTARAETMSGKTQVIEAGTKQKLQVIGQEMQAELMKMQAENTREIAKITAAADFYVTKKRADADLVNAELGAQGQLLVKTAEAEGEMLRNAAMLGVGGSTIVALEAARNLNFAEVTISTLMVDLLDIDAMATKLGVPETKGR